MSTFLITLLAVVVTLSHARMLRVAQRQQGAAQAVRERLWRRHLLVNGLAWLGLFAAIVVFEVSLPRQAVSLPVQIVGVSLVISGLTLVAWVRCLFGRDQAMGVRFFLPERLQKVSGGPFRYLRNPMYDGFLGVLIGLALLFGNPENLILAGVSFLLLNVYLAAIENSGL